VQLCRPIVVNIYIYIYIYIYIFICVIRTVMKYVIYLSTKDETTYRMINCIRSTEGVEQLAVFNVETL